MNGLEFSLLRPLWLLALLPLAGLAWFCWMRRDGIGDWKRAADPALMQAMAALGHVEHASRRYPILALPAALALMVLALSGPAIERRDTGSYRNLDGAIFVIDVSQSVTEHDRWPALLTMGRFGLAALGTRPGGVIVFAGDAYVAVDMTHDHLQLGQTLSLIDPDIVPDAGTRPERALELATTVLSGGDVLAGDVILFTDGAGLGAPSLKATGQLAAQGARLSIVSIDDVSSPQMVSHVAVGQGRLFTATQTDTFAEWLADDARMRLERQDYPLLFWKDIGRYLLWGGLALLLVLFRREAA